MVRPRSYSHSRRGIAPASPAWRPPLVREAAPPIPGRRRTGVRFRGPAPRNGVSLVEVMVVLTIVGILVAMAVPRYERTLEQSRADIAAANLRAIWSAERAYWLEHHSYTADLSGLQALGLLDSAVVLATTGYVYAVPSADSITFTATATRTGSSRWNGQYTMDEAGTVAGVIHAPGEPDISPGFQ
jgi:prepilin-type N-terminal cleavage/methylation domain-containing protein